MLQGTAKILGDAEKQKELYMRTLKLIAIIATSVTTGILAAKGVEYGGRKLYEKGKEQIKKEIKKIAKDGQ